MSDRYAVFGNPIEHSLSPGIHQDFAEQTQQDIEYVRQLVSLDGFDKAAGKFFAAGGCGLNITVPFKAEAYGFAAQLSKRARQAGAVNTLAVDSSGVVRGDNTDGVGLLRDLTGNLQWPLQGRRVLLLGAGGAARGVMAPLLEAGPHGLTVANRTVEKARQLALAFQALGPVSALGYDELAGRQFDLVINATSAGLAGSMPELPQGLLAEDACAYDMVYGARPTTFMQWAADTAGAEVADGLGMLVEQAAESFFIWRGVMPLTKPVITRIRQSLSPD